MIPEYQFELIKGDTFDLELTVTDINRTPYDLTESSVSLHLVYNNNVVNTFTINEHKDPKQGVTILSIPSSFTATLNQNKIYDFYIKVSHNDKIYTVAKGKLKIL